jgi:hypothetical protein
MTDVLSGLNHDSLDSVSTAESAPRAPKESPASPTIHKCHYCDDTFEGVSGPVRRGYHEKQKHHDDWAKAKAGTATKKRPAKKTTATKKASPRPAVGVPKRASASESVSSVLEMVGGFIGNVTGDKPLGRALQFSAPATGEAVDDLIAGTVVDRWTQPLVKGADKWEKVGSVLGFPILVAIIERNPAMYDVLESQLRSATLDVIVGSIPSMKKKAAREKEAISALAQLGEIDPRYADAPDPLGLFLQDLFGYNPATTVNSEVVGDGPTL